MTQLVKGVTNTLFGSQPSMPAAAPPAVMPTPDDAKVREARRQAMLQAQARGGRASTILTGTDDKLG